MRYEINLNVIKTLKSKNPNLELLKKYSGWGGLREAVYTPEIYRQMRKFLSHEEIDSIKKTFKNAYFTPPEIVKFMYQWLVDYGFQSGDILEPSIGHGVFIEHMPEMIKAKSQITAIEIDTTSCKIVQALYPKVGLHNCGFEDFNNDHKYGLIIGNPPYSSQTVMDLQHRDLNGYCIHHYFVAKAMRLLKEDGILAMVLPSYFLDNVTKHVRHIIQREGGNLITAFRLPDDLFADATVTTDIIFLKKGKTNIPWVNVRRIMVDGLLVPINEFFYHHKENILGDLSLVDMYGRKGLTCKRNGKNPLELLTAKLVKPSAKLSLLDYIKKIETSIQELHSLKDSLLKNFG